MESLPNEGQLREKQGEKIVGFLKKIKAFEFFQELRENPETVESVTFDEFRDFLVRLNGIARDIPIHERHQDGEHVYLGGFVDTTLVPKQADKEPLLKKAFESRQNLKYPEDAEYMLPATVNAVHLFNDGNGRTSRVLNMLLSSHDSELEFEEKLKKALAHGGRFDSLDINPSLVNRDIEKIVFIRHGMVFEEGPGLHPVFSDGFTRFFTLEKPENLKAKEFVTKRNDDAFPCFISAYNYLKAQRLLDKVIATKNDFPELSLPDDYKALSFKKMDEILSVQDWENILQGYYNLKKEHVEVLIDSFVKPEEYMTRDGSMTVRDSFIKSINDSYLKNQKDFAQ